MSATASRAAGGEGIARADLIARYDGRAPRYTSYPTALQFGPEVTGEVYAGWLGELPEQTAVSLYVHIPFCSRLCWYCGCNTRATQRSEPVTTYVDRLLDELSLLEGALPTRLPARALHLGGGTPNLVSRDDLGRLFGALRHTFALSRSAEVAAELDPAVLTRDWVQAAASHGLNRASLGVQDLSPAVQQAVNRIEPFEVVARAVGWLREIGVLSVNLDLMYGLPRQTVACVLSTLDSVLTLRPERLALFGYAHVPWMKAHQQLIEDQYLPGPAERLDQSEAAAERLVAEGYVRLGIDHFALPTDDLARASGEARLHRNFQGYTTDSAPTLLGIGASSISRLPQGYVQNHASERIWRDAIRKGDLPVGRGVAFTAEDRFRGEIIERLMCDLRVDLAQVCARHGRAPSTLEREIDSLQTFAEDGLLRIDGPRVTITEQGRPIVRTICSAFDAYLNPHAVHHSRTL